MFMSNKIFELLCGDASKVNKMEGEDLRLVFYNNLKVFSYNEVNMHRNFNNTSWLKQPEFPRQFPINMLINNCQHI